FFSSRRRHTRSKRDWSSDVCSSDLQIKAMKKVSGTLRLDLASYRELEAFTQFGSDLDQATQSKLNRGKRTVEVLKQKLHAPLEVEKQVVILFALTHGYLDSIPVNQILDFEAALFDFIEKNHNDLLDTIRTTKDLPDEDALNAAIKECKNNFLEIENSNRSIREHFEANE